MSNKQAKTDWQKGQRLSEHGFALKKRPAVRFDGPRETVMHAHCKLAIAREIMRRGRNYDTEVRGPGGRVDVLDMGPPDEQPIVYEVETDATSADRRAKVEQYAVGPVRDVIVLDPADAPENVHELTRWAEQEVVG